MPVLPPVKFTVQRVDMVSRNSMNKSGLMGRAELIAINGIYLSYFSEPYVRYLTSG